VCSRFDLQESFAFFQGPLCFPFGKKTKEGVPPMANISPYPVGIKNFPTWCRMGAVKNRYFVPKNFHSPRGAEWVPSKTGILCVKTSILHVELPFSTHTVSKVPRKRTNGRRLLCNLWADCLDHKDWEDASLRQP
jgi:hypothetical protein